MFSLDEYQQAAIRTDDTSRAWELALAIKGLGITGEAGEVADEIKKIVGHGHEVNHEKLTKELGDVLWYVATAAHLLGISLSTVAAVNIQKLKERYPDGWDPKRSQNREDK